MSYLARHVLRRPVSAGAPRASGARVDERIVLNLADFDGGAHVRAVVEDTSAQRVRRRRIPSPRLKLRITDCAGAIHLEFSVDSAAEREKPSAERLPGYGDSQLPLLKKQVLDVTPVYPALEQQTLEFWLSKAREYLTADDPDTKLLLGKDSPEALSKRLATSKLGDAAVRKALWDGGWAAVKASSDPMIQYAIRIDPEARRLLTLYNEKVSGPTTAASEALAKARFAAYGTSVYPDATFTLRLSYGQIAGWNEKGKEVPPFTYFGGLYERATGQDPFKLDPRWIAAKGKLNPGTVFDISTTNDIIGGNSGSQLINARGEVIGAIFDGNIHSIGGDYGYDPSNNRSVAVSTAAVSEALRKVYGAGNIADELARP